MESDQPPISQSPSRTWRRMAMVVSGVVLTVIAWWFFFSSRPILLTATSAPSEKGWQTVKEPFWVKAEAAATLPPESQWNGQYIIMVYQNGKPFYQRMIDVEQIQAGRPFDLALEKSGKQYSAAFVEIEKGQPGRRLSNTLSFTH